MRTWDIIGKRRWGYLLSVLVVLPGVVALAVWGINLGIDFTGGTLLDLRLGRAAPLEEVRAALAPFGHADAAIQLSPERPSQVLVRSRPIEEAELAQIQAAFASRFGGVEILRAERVGPKIGQELRARAIQAVVIGLLLQVLYITVRFRSLRFALAADVALLHDLLIVVGVFALARKEVDSSFVAVLLTVVGYSINDTVVVLDRIREEQNLRTREPFPRLVNRSILEVLVRSLTTGVGALVALLIIYLFGGPTLRDFVFGLGLGVIVGTYSSIFVASPILVDWHNWSERRRGGRPSAPAVVREGRAAPELAPVGAGPAVQPPLPAPRRRRRRHR